MKKLVVGALVIGGFIAANAAATGTTEVPAAKYVQEGLVLMVDGIENAGPGQHDAAAMKLLDLAGGGFENALDESEEVREKSFLLKKGHVFEGVFARLGGMPKDSMTLEIVAHPWPKNGSSWAYSYDANVLNGADFGHIAYDTRSPGGFSTSFKKNWVSESRDRYYYYIAASPHGRIENHIKSTAAPLCVSSVFKANATTPWVENVSRSITYFWQGNGSGYSDKVTVGNANEYTEVYTIRVYNRTLTADERAFNYALDRNRFFGDPIPSDMRLRVKPIPAQTFDGVHPVEVTPVVEDVVYGNVLKEGDDYACAITGNGCTGMATVTITGKGEAYAGCNAQAQFKIVSAYGGSTLFVSPTGSDSADCLTWATAGTISNACGRATAGTAEERTTIVLKSGTAENPAVYDLSAVKLPAFGAYASIPNAYVTVRSENLDRAGCVIRGGPEQDFRLFHVTGANARFEGLTVEGHRCIGATATGNYSTANGFGGVLWGTANTVVTNCSFIANTSGGSSLNSGRYTDCTFISNTNTVSTGWRFGGLMSGDLQLAGCLFVSNVATAGFCVFGRCGNTVTVTNCTFRHHFKGSGVVGYSSSDAGSCRFDDCTFVSNSVTSMASGGRIVDTCRFIDNSATCAAAGICTNCTFSGATSYVANGGTLRCSTVTGCNAPILFWHAYVYNSTICSNTVTSAMCARMYRFEDNLVVHNTFTGTLAGDAYYIETVPYGGPTFWRDTIVSNDFAGRAVSATYFFYNCLLAHNTVTAETGVRSLIDTGYFFNCTVADNTLVSTAAGTSAVSGGYLRNCVVYGNSPCDLKGTGGTLTNVLYKTVYDAASLEARGTTFKVHPRFQTADAAHPYGYAPRFGAPQTKLGDATVLILANKAPSHNQFNIATNVWPEASVDLACEPRFNGETPDLGCYECWYPQAGFLLFVK